MKSTASFRPLLWAILFLLLLVLGAEAFATGKPPAPDPEPAPTATAAADAAALAEARAASAAGAVAGSNAAGGSGGASDASSVADGGNARATGGDGIGTVEGDSTRVQSWGIALNVPAATAAPAVPGRCLEHSRGWAAGWGAGSRSGGTKLQALCEERLHCLSIADMYARVGAFQAMADQLASCGGVKVTLPPPVPTAAPIDAVPRAEFEATVRRLEERQERMFQRGAGK